MNSKKCPSCGEWSGWDQSVDDRCERCGALLSPREHSEKEILKEREKEEKEWFNIALITIKPEDNVLVRGLKLIARSFQMVFIAIMSFIIWLVTVATG